MLVQLLLGYQKRAAKLLTVQAPLQRRIQNYEESIKKTAAKLKEEIEPKVDPLEQDFDVVRGRFDQLFAIFFNLQTEAAAVLEKPKRKDEVALTPDDTSQIQDMMYQVRMEAEAISNYLEGFRHDLDIIRRSLSSTDVGSASAEPLEVEDPEEV